MKILLLKYWDRLRSSFWFVPAAMACLAVALDRAIAGDFLKRLGWSYSVLVEPHWLPNGDPRHG